MAAPGAVNSPWFPATAICITHSELGTPMSPLLWLQRLFVPKEDTENTDTLPEIENEDPFVFSQHLRIIAAILFSLVSAGILWWIMA